MLYKEMPVVLSHWHFLFEGVSLKKNRPSLDNNRRSEYWLQAAKGCTLSVLALYAIGVFGYVTATLATFFVGRAPIATKLNWQLLNNWPYSGMR